jgi:hypothetical protein
MWRHRFLCDVLAEMRKCHETRNYSYLSGLIEEAQSMGNRMESAIEYLNDIEKLYDERKKLLKEVKDLKKSLKKKDTKHK